MSNPYPGPSARKLAVISAAANLTVCALIGVPILASHARDSNTITAAPAPPVITTLPPRVASVQPTTSATETPGFEKASGPAGITTLIPTGWQVAPASGPGSVQATDPNQSSRFLRYGGSASPTTDLLTTQQEFERTFSTTTAGYALVDLSPSTLRGVQAVTWEFEFDSTNGRKHVKSKFWRTAGNDYFVYASSALADWSEMNAIFGTAVSNSVP